MIYFLKPKGSPEGKAIGIHFRAANHEIFEIYKKDFIKMLKLAEGVLGGTKPSETEKLNEQNKLSLMKQHYEKAMQYYNKGEYQDAIKEFEKILQFKPDHKRSLGMIGKCKEKLQ